jgi:hypothetical protein
VLSIKAKENQFIFEREIEREREKEKKRPKEANKTCLFNFLEHTQNKFL